MQSLYSQEGNVKEVYYFEHSTLAAIVASVTKDMETQWHGMVGDRWDCSIWNQIVQPTLTAYVIWW